MEVDTFAGSFGGDHDLHVVFFKLVDEGFAAVSGFDAGDEVGVLILGFPLVVYLCLFGRFVVAVEEEVLACKTLFFKDFGDVFLRESGLGKDDGFFGGF